MLMPKIDQFQMNSDS